MSIGTRHRRKSYVRGVTRSGGCDASDLAASLQRIETRIVELNQTMREMVKMLTRR